MAAPHNETRYGELWPQARIEAMLRELEPLRILIVLSGGWAWHFMSPSGHPEYKHTHDHKDADIFVHPTESATVQTRLEAAGFYRVSTRYDRSTGDFRRLEKAVSDANGKAFKLTIDLFIRNVPFRVVKGFWRVVEPRFLLGLYGSVHTSSECFAVRAAKILVANGVDPVDHPSLVEIPYSKGQSPWT